MLNAFRPLAADLLSTLFFVALINLTHDVMLATGVAMAVGLGQIVWLRLKGRPIAALQWMSLVLVISMGAATLVTHDPRFVMVKPTIVYLAVGAAMLQRGWMARYMPPIVQQHGPNIPIRFGYVWAGMMFATAAANALVALTLSPAAWSAFIAVFPLVSKLLLFAIQYVVTRRIIVSRRAASAALLPGAA
ncbi:MAG: septation protein IspZ [Caulobacteraceae bacterium]|nr:septation protein IspZ [Caulobacteraceae bacterium]